jgi:hypothetical protein
VNLDFLNAHCRTDAHVKAVICHEFLHVVLRHTEAKGPFTVERHLAFDAVINAIIHRQFGEAYSSMMAEYYKGESGLMRLLRPMARGELNSLRDYHWHWASVPQWVSAWEALYEGKLVVDDIEALARELRRQGGKAARAEGGAAGGRSGSGCGGAGGGGKAGGCELPEGIGDFLGDHENLGRGVPEEMKEAMGEVLRQMGDTGIWRDAKGRGVGGGAGAVLLEARNEPMRRWERKTLEILRRHLTPDRRSRRTRLEETEYRLPVLSPRDRRAFVRALWGTFLPEATWSADRRRGQGTAQVYLDVSGSMDDEMPAVIALLARLSRYIRRPFWAFSTEVAPAVIEKGGLLNTRTTGGTRLGCVLEHIAKTRPEAAVVLTDGYVEQLERRDIMKIKGTRLHILVTRDGSAAAVERAGLPYTQLDKVPS